VTSQLRPSSLSRASVCGHWASKSNSDVSDEDIQSWSEKEFDPDEVTDYGTLLHAIIEMWLDRSQDEMAISYTGLKNIFFPPNQCTDAEKKEYNQLWVDELTRKSRMISSASKTQNIIKTYSSGFSRVAKEIRELGAGLGGIEEIVCEIRLPLPPGSSTNAPFIQLDEFNARIRGICDALLVCKEGLVFFDWKSRVPRDPSPIHQTQIALYMSIASKDPIFSDRFSSHMDLEWWGCVVGLHNDGPEHGHLFPRERDVDILSELITRQVEGEQNESQYCKWYCLSLADEDNPCRRYSLTDAAKTLRDDDFWQGYYKSGKGAYEHRFESDIEAHWSHAEIKIGKKIIDVKFTGPHPPIPRNSNVRMIGTLSRHNSEEAHLYVEQVIIL